MTLLESGGTAGHPAFPWFCPIPRPDLLMGRRIQVHPSAEHVGCPPPPPESPRSSYGGCRSQVRARRLWRSCRRSAAGRDEPNHLTAVSPGPTEDLTPFLLFFLLSSCNRCLCARENPAHSPPAPAKAAQPFKRWRGGEREDALCLTRDRASAGKFSPKRGRSPNQSSHQAPPRHACVLLT